MPIYASVDGDADHCYRLLQDDGSNGALVQRGWTAEMLTSLGQVDYEAREQLVAWTPITLANHIKEETTTWKNWVRDTAAIRAVPVPIRANVELMLTDLIKQRRSASVS